MAWESFEEEALHIIGLHMSVMTREQKEALNKLYFQHIFLERKDTWSMEPDFGWNIVEWIAIDASLLTMWDEEHLLSNIRFAMIQELMKTRPAKYCIINSQVPSFESKLLLLTNYLPH